MNCNMTRTKLIEGYYKELGEDQQQQFAAHLQNCPQCAAEFGKLSSVLDLLKTRKVEEPDSEFWENYYARLESRRMKKPAALKSPKLFGITPALVYQLAAAVVLVSIGIIIGKFYFGQNAGPIAQMPIAPRAVPAPPEIQRAHDFLNRSQVLLLGIVNGMPEDLAREKEVSHQLVQQASLVKKDLNNSKDRRLKELVSELEIILLQIANLEEQGDLRAVEMVRSGVDRKGVLLKIDLEQMRLSDLAPARPDPKGRRKNVY